MAIKEEELFNIIGKNVKYYRQLYNLEHQKMTQEQLAEKANVSTALIGNLESNKINQGISVITLYRLSQILNVTMDDFCKMPPNQQKNKNGNQ
ncbi:MAG: helix-turn-helix transcriptional regulator [Bacilli bacterium]|nr:helix-turn-helix transcriptional regulator [Bacilli bacterium]